MTREEAIEFLNTDDYESKGYNDAVKMGIEALKEQRPHGEWIPMITKGDYGEQVLRYYKCKTCGWLKQHDKMPFCENCGADMRKERGDEK